MKRRNRLVLIGIIAIATIVLLTLIIAPSRDRLSNGSTFSRAPGGYGAWYAFMEQRGTPVRRWKQSFSDLNEKSEAGPIVLLRVNSELNRRWIDENTRNWIEAGNILVILGVRVPVSAAPFRSLQSSSVGEVSIATRRRYSRRDRQNPFPEEEESTVVMKPRKWVRSSLQLPASGEPTLNAIASAPLDGGSELSLPIPFTPSPFPASPLVPEWVNPEINETLGALHARSHSSSNGATPTVDDSPVLLGDSFGAVVWRKQYGEGQAIFAATPYLAANAYQDESGNYEFLAELLTQWDHPIWVDEYIHGYKNKDAIAQAQDNANPTWLTYLAETPLLPIGLQLGVILLVLIWAQNRRFGQPLALTAPPVDNSKAYIGALSGVLQKAGRCEFILEVLGKEEQRQLQRALGLGDTPVDRQILLDAWVQHTGRPASELEAILQVPSTSIQPSEATILNWLAKWQSVRRHLPS